MRLEDEALSEQEWRNFRYMLFATHPAEASDLLASVDEARERSLMTQEGYEEYAEVIPDEILYGEDFEFQPRSAEEVQDAIDMMRRFGMAFE